MRSVLNVRLGCAQVDVAELEGQRGLGSPPYWLR